MLIFSDFIFENQRQLSQYRWQGLHFTIWLEPWFTSQHVSRSLRNAQEQMCKQILVTLKSLSVLLQL